MAVVDTLLAGRYFIDGIDLWSSYAITVKKGSADFLRFPEVKQSIEHDWPNQHGLDVDKSRVFFKELTGTLECHLYALSENEFWEKRNAFLARIGQPGLRRLTITAHQGRSYMIEYRNTLNYKQEPKRTLRNQQGQRLILHSFSLVVRQPQPNLDQMTDVYLGTDEGGFLIL